MGGVGALKFSVVIPTRGDVDLTPIISSYDGIADEVLVWDNSKREDLAVYGRYAMIAEARNELIVTQDDDCVVSDLQALVDAYTDGGRVVQSESVVCNMPPEFRHEFYREHALVGFGACFHRDAPRRAFKRFDPAALERHGFSRTCDIVFTALTPRVLVDVPYTNLWWAEDETRMYRQPQHVEERMRMLELVRGVRAG